MDAASAPAGAPPASPSNGATNGANGPQSPAKAPPPTTVVRPNPTPKPQSAPANTAKDHALGRGKNGQFLGKNGEPAQAQEPEVKEPFRFKRKIKTDGAEEEIDYSEDELVRELQLSRTARKRLSDIATRQKELDAREARLKTAPHEVLTEAGIDPDEWATKRLAQKAQDGLMSDEERAYRAKEQEATELRAKLEHYERRQQEQETQAYEDEIWKKEEPALLEAFRKHALPLGPEVMDLVGKVGVQFYDAKMPMSADHIAAETSARLDKYASRYVFDLPLSDLMRKLGQEKVESIVREHIRQFRKSQSEAGFADAPHGESNAPPPEEPGNRRSFISSAEVDRRARELISKMK